MTPTNDAPVTVEQCDREAAHRTMLAMHGDDWRGLLKGDEDQHPLVQSHARHRLAALASAPAGDGKTIDALYGSIRGLRSVLQDIANDEGDTVLGRRCIAAISKSRVAALARPRAGVGEQSRSRRLTEEEARELVGFEPETILTCLREWGYVEDTALQSPPAKVEG